MPWKVASAMSQREEFVALAKTEGGIVEQNCVAQWDQPQDRVQVAEPIP